MSARGAAPAIAAPVLIGGAFERFEVRNSDTPGPLVCRGRSRSGRTRSAKFLVDVRDQAGSRRVHCRRLSSNRFAHHAFYRDCDSDKFSRSGFILSATNRA